MTGPCGACGGVGCEACDWQLECPGCGERAKLRRSSLGAEECAAIGRTGYACTCGRLAGPRDLRLVATRDARA